MHDLTSRLLGKYQVLGLLGRGGMAEVYRAYQASLDREVAIKVLDMRLSSDPDFASRFRLEASMVARLRHPNIVQVFDLDIDTEANSLYMVMELVRGPTLRAELDQRLVSQQPFTMREVAAMCGDLASALDHAHKQGMIHRDVKPGNIMFTDDNRLILTDFGLARVVEDERRTNVGQMVGTPAYMSPEQCRGVGGGVASDVYSLGVVLYEIITGRLPFIAEETIAVAMKHVTEQPPSIRGLRAGVPAAVEGVVMRALAKEPRQRYPSAGALARALEQALGISVSTSMPIVSPVAIASVDAPDLASDPSPAHPTLVDGATAGAMDDTPVSSQQSAVSNEWALAHEPTRNATVATRDKPSFLDHAAVEVTTSSGVFAACEDELHGLAVGISAAVAGHGTLVFVSGEAGRGKTTMLQELARRAQRTHSDILVARGVCDAYTGVSNPYAPFRQVLGTLIGDIESQCLAGAISSEHANRIWRAVPNAIQALMSSGPSLVPALVPSAIIQRRIAEFPSYSSDWRSRLAHLEQYAAGNIPDQAQIFRQYADVLIALSVTHPLVIMLDDLHWVDASSVRLLHYLAGRIRAARIYIVGAYRPEDLNLANTETEHPLTTALRELKPILGEVGVDLDESAPGEQRAFVDALLDAEPNRLSQRFRAAMTRHTGGQPLFTVELLRDMQERGYLRRDDDGVWVESETLSWDALPAKVEGVMERRFGRLDPELRETLAVASVEGEEFTAEVIAKVRGIEVRRVLRQLDRELNQRHRLVKERSLVRLASGRRSLYVFRHNLFQKYLYGELGAAERALLHEDVGAALEELYAEDPGAVAAQLARHYRESGQLDQAIVQLRVAGERAVQSYANQEATDLLCAALDLLGSAPGSREREVMELELVSLLAPVLVARQGYASRAAKEAFERARDLAQKLGDQERLLLQALKGLWVAHFVRGELALALVLGTELFELSEWRGGADVLIEANYVLGGSYCEAGEFRRSRDHFAAALKHYEPSQHSMQVRFFGPNLGVFCRVWMSHPMWALGAVDSAVSRAEEGIAMARELAHPFSLAVALSYAAMMYQLRRDPEAVARTAAQALVVCQEHGFAYYLAWSDMLHAWAMSLLGDDPRAELGRLRKGLDALNATGGRVREPYYLSLLADILTLAGETEQALVVVARARRLADDNDDHWWDAHLAGLQAQHLLADTDAGDASLVRAEERYRESIAIAKRQGAISLELRSAVGLGRVLMTSGQAAEARSLVAQVLGRFKEGKKTTDQLEARALLEELDRISG